MFSESGTAEIRHGEKAYNQPLTQIRILGPQTGDFTPERSYTVIKGLSEQENMTCSVDVWRCE